MTTQLADALVAALKRIDNVLDAGQWLTKPVTVDRGLVLNLGNVERPALIVNVDSWTDEPIGMSRHRKTVTVNIYLITTGDELAEKLLGDLCSDVEKAITDDEMLGGLLKEVPAMSYRGEAEAMQRSGLGLGVVTFNALVEWEHSAP
jgi:hypothetical protein